MNACCHCFVSNVERPTDGIISNAVWEIHISHYISNKGSGKLFLYDPVNHNTRLYKQLLSHLLLGKANRFSFIILIKLHEPVKRVFVFISQILV